jgi:hypothetical protein
LSTASSPALTIVELNGHELGVAVQFWQQAGWSFATLRSVRPFSWDAKHRAFETVDIELGPSPTILVCGPYAAADAAAFNTRPDHHVGFPESDEHDGVPYLLTGKPAEPGQRYQDAAGWFTIAGHSQIGEELFAYAALERSNTQLVLIELQDSVLSLKLILPAQVYPVAACGELEDLPQMKVASGQGDHRHATELLREVIVQSMPLRARHYTPPLIVDTWGFGTKVNQELVESVAASAQNLELDIVTVDKGWEKEIGVWQTGSHFPDGVEGLSRITRSRNLRLGLWASLGNIAPLSELAKQNPDWIATWRGKHQIVSHRNFSLCLGHSPVINYLRDSLAYLAQNGMTWLLHDFETISRCDSTAHDHPAGLGEDWAVRGWYFLLSEFREKFPQVWIENCWNGGRPLDLQMLAHHDTSIGDDWCDVRHNAVAKVGMGAYLPAHWCTSYMADQDQLPLRSQFAIFAVGGPWVLMGNIPKWTQEKTELARRVIKVHKVWRSLFSEGYVSWAQISGWQPDKRWRADQELLGISFFHPSGKELMALVLSEPLSASQVIWHPRSQGRLKITDEFTGDSWLIDSADAVQIDSSAANGHLLSATPIN